MVEILMHHAVGEPLCAHVVEMVGGLKHRPVLLKFLILDAVHLGVQVVQSAEGVVLQGVA